MSLIKSLSPVVSFNVREATQNERITDIVTLESIIMPNIITTMHRSSNGGTKGNVRIADPEIEGELRRPSLPAPLDSDDVSISSGSSSSSASISKQFVEDSTSETGVSTSKRSMSTAEATGANWFHDNMNVSRSSSLVLGLVLLSAVILGAVFFSVAMMQDDEAFRNEVCHCGQNGNRSAR